MKKILILVLATGFMFAPPATIYGQSENLNSQDLRLVEDQQLSENFKKRLKDVRQTVEEKLTEVKARNFERRCEAIKSKIAGVATKNQSHNNRQDIVFEQWRTRIAQLVVKVNATGIDTSQLEAYLEEFETIVSQNKEDYQNYLVGLEDLSTADCTNSTEVFYENIQSARATRLLIIQNSKDAVKVIRDNIKVELQSIRSQLQELPESSEDGEGV